MKEKIKSGTEVIGQTLSGRIVKGVLSYENFNPIITDKDGQRWLIERKKIKTID